MRYRPPRTALFTLNYLVGEYLHRVDRPARRYDLLRE
jgi:hypothetical protein